MPRRRAAEPPKIPPPGTPFSWVRLPHYCAITGEAPSVVHARRYNGRWLDGVHCRVIDHALWINLAAVNAWIEGGADCTAQGPPRHV
jgi:hypothetical protein